jgi:serine/threonine protein kinase
MSLIFMIEAETGEFVILKIPLQIENYTVRRIIGNGSTCVVVEATNDSTDKDYAIKVMSSSDLESRSVYSNVKNELAILARVSHNHVIQFREVITCGVLLCVVTENCTGGDLFEWIKNGRTTDRAILVRIFFEICLAIQYLHNEGITHNDIKPENVILDDRGTAKIIDFGYAQMDASGGDHQKAGSLPYAAPEVFTRESYDTQKADIWSLAIVLYVMATGKSPFSGESDRTIIRQIIFGRLRYGPEMDAEITALVRRMTRVNPNDRPTIEQVLEDPLFDGVREPRVQKVNQHIPDSIATAVENEMVHNICAL